MSEELYRQLQRRLDSYSLGFPETETGIEIAILKRLFCEKDAELFLAMSPMLEEPASVADRLGKPADELAAQLEDMASRGLLFRLRKAETVKYAAIPFMHGLMEFQVQRLDPEVVAMLEQYFDQGLHQAIAGVNGLFLRTVPVGKSILPEHHVAAFEDARKILEKNELIVVAECFCRKAKRLHGEGCEKPLEACFMFGSMARYYLENKLGRQVDRTEAIALLEKAQEEGLVTQPSTAQNPAGMCNCCGDCCGVLAAIRKHEKPAEIVFSNFQAAVSAETCTGCEQCLDRCQMEAIQITEDGVARIDLDRCIGCGLCVTTCPAGSIQLQPKARQKTPPETSRDQMLQMAQLRGLFR